MVYCCPFQPMLKFGTDFQIGRHVRPEAVNLIKQKLIGVGCLDPNGENIEDGTVTTVKLAYGPNVHKDLLLTSTIKRGQGKGRFDFTVENGNVIGVNPEEINVSGFIQNLSHLKANVKTPRPVRPALGTEIKLIA